ncbi:sigma-70 family RNA polymerase sigma factor [Nocardioides perillae]|uniref:RNA polymerase sigma-B factor n=1 Tax=Nocardioides perillae TaxID=1119534 RepID=A0A7Y9RQG4_9ACTN|nr:sigma-70 family RNA polymerase sigma factor [Nocardioides perillae]NYG54652.1 RNA polymerase sigma-B factor [Nocardioides perillae]
MASAAEREERRVATRELYEQVRATDDEAERRELWDRIVVLNMPVAEAVARRLGGRGSSLDDLYQVAYAALVRVVRAYDPSKGEDLLSYAVPSISGEVRRHFRDHGWAVRPPREVQRAHGRVSAQGPLPERCSVASVSRIAGDVGEDAATVYEALSAGSCRRAVSLDHPFLDGEGDSLGAFLADAEDRSMGCADARLLLEPLLRALDPLERAVLRLRFAEGLTQREIAAELGLTQARVSRLLHRVLTSMRASLAGLDEVAVAS